MNVKRFACFLFIFTLSLCAAFAQQVPDFNFNPPIAHPAYAEGKGSLIVIDEAHHNFHTKDGRFSAFARLLQKDGYVVKSNTEAFSSKGLKGSKILVIANAIHISDTADWIVPNPSAFTTKEIKVVNKWVKDGGSLFFIADHMPFPGAGEALAKSFGFTFYNGFAVDTSFGLFPGSKKDLDYFERDKGTLANHPVSNGRSADEKVTKVATFTGQGFKIPGKAVSLFTFDKNYKILLPDTAWKFSQETPRFDLNGYSQGAVLQWGKGRVAVFGEAAMFSAQLAGTDKKPMGMNNPKANENAQFLLNLIHWLDGKI